MEVVSRPRRPVAGRGLTAHMHNSTHYRSWQPEVYVDLAPTNLPSTGFTGSTPELLLEFCHDG